MLNPENVILNLVQNLFRTGLVQHLIINVRRKFSDSTYKKVK